MGPTTLLPPTPKEIKLQIFIALKNPLLTARFEPANLGSSGKHDNHYTIENDFQVMTHHQEILLFDTKLPN
jgi:hypothetical protein